MTVHSNAGPHILWEKECENAFLVSQINKEIKEQSLNNWNGQYSINKEMQRNEWIMEKLLWESREEFKLLFQFLLKKQFNFRDWIRGL